MKIRVYPKVNLCLKVYKKQNESKHRIDSVMCLYKKIYDTVIIKKSKEQFITYQEKGKEICIPDCLISRSLSYLQSRFNVNTNYHIKVIKKIPYGSGLGGGSADAAAVINYILQKNATIHLDLKDVALSLGSDIPFFLTKYSIARVKDYGQYVAPIHPWNINFTVLIPNSLCSTKKVFDALDMDKEYVSKVDVEKLMKRHLFNQPINGAFYNDLTKYIIQAYPELQSVYKQHYKNCFFTGSGCAIVIVK